MGVIPPLRFAVTLPLAGKKDKREQSVQAIRGRIPAGGKCAGDMGGKLTAQGDFAKSRKSCQPLARQGSQCKPFSLKSNPMKKVNPTMSKRPTPKLANATQNTQVFSGKRKIAESACGLWRGAAPKKGKPTQKRATLDGGEWRRVFDGSVSETQHSEYHSGYKSFCIRCDVHKRQKVYEACAWHAGSSWLARGVRRGLWGLGCTVCANYLASGRKNNGARFSKFAKFDVRPTSGFIARWAIEQHHSSESHRMACEAKDRSEMGAVARGAKRKQPSTSAVPPQPLACPTSCPAERLYEVSAGDAALLKGNVPTAAEWKEGWAFLSETVSLRKGGRIFDKQNNNGTSVCNRTRKRYRQQLRVMAEVLRRRVRKVLSDATSISLALDECKYRKIVRYRADIPSGKKAEPGSTWRHVGASGFSHSGVLGLLDCSKKHASDFEEDHAVTAVRQLDSFLTKFCTPLGRITGRRGVQPLACDLALKTHVMKAVTCVSADGAAKERRAVFLAARDLFPNVLIVIRDPAHSIRIASKALHCDDLFGEVWRELFDGRHALVPDLMNSSKWHNLLVAIQEDNIAAVAMPRVTQPLASVMRNVAFAKQRFDSTAGPVAKIALMILPVATLLAYIASDRRHERCQRERATTLLRKLESRFCAAIGVSADWGIICNWFLDLARNETKHRK